MAEHPDTPLVECRGLVQAYGATEVLHGIDLQLPRGAVGLLGPNGSGKSTLLRTLLGLLPLRGGSARVLGLDVATEAVEIRRRIGLVPESDCLVPGMNAVELTSYLGEISGLERRDAIERAHLSLQYVGLGEARYRDLEGYSQGMKQRLKLAQALVHDPDLLLLDEPTNGMDPPGREQMLELVRDISSTKGISVILSTHLLPDVEATCDQVVVLKEGHVAGQRQVAREILDAGRIFDLIGRGDFTPLARRLGEAGHQCAEVEGGLRVSLPPGVGQEAIFEAVVALGEDGPEVRHCFEAGHTLQDHFLEAIR